MSHTINRQHTSLTYYVIGIFFSEQDYPSRNICESSYQAYSAPSQGLILFTMSTLLNKINYTLIISVPALLNPSKGYKPQLQSSHRLGSLLYERGVPWYPCWHLHCVQIYKHLDYPLLKPEI